MTNDLISKSALIDAIKEQQEYAVKLMRDNGHSSAAEFTESHQKDILRLINSAPVVNGEAVAWCVKNPNADSPKLLIYGNELALNVGDNLYLAPPQLSTVEAERDRYKAKVKSLEEELTDLIDDRNEELDKDK